MSKKLINHDAAYALGEEAFRAGLNAAYRDITGRECPAHFADKLWSEYEPSEDVKELIGDLNEQPELVQLSREQLDKLKEQAAAQRLDRTAGG